MKLGDPTTRLFPKSYSEFEKVLVATSAWLLRTGQTTHSGAPTIHFVVESATRACAAAGGAISTQRAGWPFYGNLTDAHHGTSWIQGADPIEHG